MLTESCSHRYQSCIFSLITTIGYFSSHSFTLILVSFKLEQHVFSASFCTLFLCRLTSSLIYIHNQVIIHPLIACLTNQEVYSHSSLQNTQTPNLKCMSLPSRLLTL